MTKIIWTFLGILAATFISSKLLNIIAPDTNVALVAEVLARLFYNIAVLLFKVIGIILLLFPKAISFELDGEQKLLTEIKLSDLSVYTIIAAGFVVYTVFTSQFWLK